MCVDLFAREREGKRERENIQCFAADDDDDDDFLREV